ncbi:peptidylprolyl isomerase [Sphingomonas sp. TZW2008]|uniref:peptidylprolyl isomerase n=1 Tax=Sphingomonas sp. TZW2008 TaxID=1917973 RepID=UPI000A26E49A|nr:peptidylprolyl isomerase [Sphingomonas sp. TZW2008]
MGKKAARIARLSGMALALAGATAAIGQQVPPATVADQSVPDNAGLNIPQNLQIFGKVDPNIRKATAIVNDNVLTGTDVDQRLALIVAANNAKLTPEEADRLRLQVLRQLIDEVLQIQQAKSADVTITPAELTQSFDRLAKNFNRTPEQFRAFLASQGASERSMLRQIEAELAWQRYLRRRVEPFVNVSEEEVKGILDRLEAAKGADEFKLNEIYLAATPDRAEQVYANARQLIAEIQKGQAPFGYYARNFSEASTRGVNGDLGWVRAAQLPAELASAAAQMQVGQVVGPVQVPGGFSILYLEDKRQVLTANARDARLSLKQMTIKFPAGTTQAQASQRTADFATTIRKLQGCGSVETVAAGINAEVVQNDAIRVRDLPAPLQEIVLQLQVGQATPPFGNPQEGVRTLVICGRDDVATGQLPGAEQIQNQLEQQRVNLRAQQALRDLRRDAVIEYR